MVIYVNLVRLECMRSTAVNTRPVSFRGVPCYWRKLVLVNSWKSVTMLLRVSTPCIARCYVSNIYFVHTYLTYSRCLSYLRCLSNLKCLSYWRCLSYLKCSSYLSCVSYSRCFTYLRCLSYSRFQLLSWLTLFIINMVLFFHLNYHN